MGNIVELGLDRIAGATHSMAGFIRALGVRVAALNHETGNDSVESSAIVKLFVRQVFEILDMARSFIHHKSDLDGPLGGFNDRHFLRLNPSGHTQNSN